MPSIFSKIATGVIPSYKLAEDDKFLAILDINPLVAGHTLVFPKTETDYLFDVENSDYQLLFLFAKKVALAMKPVLDCKRIGIAVVGLEVPHAHIHLIPLNDISDIDFSKPKLKLDAGELTAIAQKIKDSYNKLNV